MSRGRSYEVEHLISFVDVAADLQASLLSEKGLGEMLHRLLSRYDADSWRPNNVLWCSAATTEEEITNFLIRVDYSPGNYTLLQPNLLSNALQKHILEYQTRPNRTNAPSSLMLILNTRSSVFQSSDPGVREVAPHEFRSMDRSRPADGANTRVFLKKLLEKCCVDVTVVVGRSGDGKSHRIRELCGHQPVVTITLHEQVHTSVIVRTLLLGQALSEAESSSSAETNVVFDVSGNTPSVDLNLVLFNLLACGRLHDVVSGQVFSFAGNRSHKWNIFIELPSHGSSGSYLNNDGDVMHRPDWNLEFETKEQDFDMDAFWENHIINRVQLPVPWFASRLEKVSATAAFLMPKNPNWELVATYLHAYRTDLTGQAWSLDAQEADPQRRAIINMDIRDVRRLAEQTPGLPDVERAKLYDASFDDYPVARSALAVQLLKSLQPHVDAALLTDSLSEQRCIDIFRAEVSRNPHILDRKLFMRIFLLYMSRRINFLNDPSSGVFFRWNAGGPENAYMGTTLLDQMSTEVVNFLDERVRDNDDAPTMQIIYGTFVPHIAANFAVQRHSVFDCA